MPFGIKPICKKCKTSETTMWRKDEGGLVTCNSCYLNSHQQNGNAASCTGDGSGRSTPQPCTDNVVVSNGNTKPPSLSTQTSVTSNGLGKDVIGTRKSARIRPSSAKGGNRQPQLKALATKGKNRRVVFKKNPSKSPSGVATIVTTESLYHNGYYYQIGDIVSLVDHSGDVYYAQLRGLLQDQYCEKSAVITWLLPTTVTPRSADLTSSHFDPATYILGPEEDLPRKLECMEFVCRAPSDYYKSLHSPYPTDGKKPDAGFIWTSIGPEICKVPTLDEIFGTKKEADGS